MIQDLDNTLKQLLIAKGNLNNGEIDIKFDAPDRDWVGKLSRPTINLFLYDVQENTELRQQDWIVERSNGRRATKSQPPAWIDLSYLVTVWTRDIEDEHRLLWHIMTVLMRHQILPDDVKQGALSRTDHTIQTQAAQPKGAYSSLAELWGSLEIPLKPSINFVVILPLDRMIELEAPLVTTKMIRVLMEEASRPEELVQIGGHVCRKKKPGEGLPNQRVILEEQGFVSLTDERGEYTFAHVPRGEHTLRVEAADGGVVDRRITVPGDDYDIDI